MEQAVYVYFYSFNGFTYKCFILIIFYTGCPLGDVSSLLVRVGEYARVSPHKTVLLHQSNVAKILSLLFSPLHHDVHSVMMMNQDALNSHNRVFVCKYEVTFVSRCCQKKLSIFSRKYCWQWLIVLATFVHSNVYFLAHVCTFLFAVYRKKRTEF